MLEPAATALAARRIAAKDVAGLRSLLERVSPSTEPEVFVAADLEFHRTVVSLCGNPVLSSLHESMSGPMHRARVWCGVTDQTAEERTIREHHAIVDALERQTLRSPRLEPPCISLASRTGCATPTPPAGRRIPRRPQTGRMRGSGPTFTCGQGVPTSWTPRNRDWSRPRGRWCHAPR